MKIKFKKEKNYGVGLGRDALRQWGCPVWQCETSDNRTDVQNYDAIVFHLRTWNKRDLPKRRSPHQRYVFFSLESPAWAAYRVARMANFFNWTMTYRWDSDMVAPYGYIAPTGDVPLHPTPNQMKKLLFLSSNETTKVNYAQGKTKMTAWFVSNCQSVVSSRNEMVKKLQKYMTIDVYGNCGNMTCPKKHKSFVSSDECRDMVAKNYKFYFALENSLCRHYVTEKYVWNVVWHFDLNYFALLLDISISFSH
jgi:alpha-1,3-fucosyltransferase